MRILALDLATETGWAVGEPCGPVRYGHFVVDMPDHADRFLQMTRRVTELIEAHSPKLVVLEAAFVGEPSTAAALYGYRAAAMIAARNSKLRVEGDNAVATIRKAFIGTGGLDRKKAKAAVIDKCRWHGWDPATEDEADALALLSYRCTLISAEHFAMAMRKGAWIATTPPR